MPLPQEVQDAKDAQDQANADVGAVVQQLLSRVLATAGLSDEVKTALASMAQSARALSAAAKAALASLP